MFTHSDSFFPLKEQENFFGGKIIVEINIKILLLRLTTEHISENTEGPIVILKHHSLLFGEFILKLNSL